MQAGPYKENKMKFSTLFAATAIVGTLAIGRAGAVNAALLAASVLALSDPELAGRLDAWRQRQSAAVAERPVDDA